MCTHTQTHTHNGVDQVLAEEGEIIQLYPMAVRYANYWLEYNSIGWHGCFNKELRTECHAESDV